MLTTSYDPALGWQDQLSVQLGGVGAPVNLLTNEAYSGAPGAMGLLTGASLGGFSGGAGSYSASYDTLGRLTSGGYSYTPTGGAASTLYQIQPTYDALSNVIESVTTLPQGTDTQVFCYDDLARLTWAGSSGTPACSGAPTPSDTGALASSGAAYSATYAYDSMNRLTSSPLGAYSYGDSAHADAATAIGSNWTGSYDAAGNMLCRAPSSATTCAGASPTGAQLGYDNQGQLATWQSTPSSPTSTDRFLYDGEGNRVEQVASSGGTTSTSTTYVGSLEEISTTGATTTTTAYYGGLALSVNGALSYTISDQLGSLSEGVGADGTTIVTQLYDPYGGARYSSGTLPGTHGYTSQHTDAATGLDYYNARYYDPLAGQFASADTTLLGGLNRYGYVGGSPETYVDPSGHVEGYEGEEGELRNGGSDPSEGGSASDGTNLNLVTVTPDGEGDGDFLKTYGEGNGATTFKVDAEGNVIPNPASDELDAESGGTGAGQERAAEWHAEEVKAENPYSNNSDATTQSARGGSSGSANAGCGLSFAADTQVATPSGERPIATLKVGDHVLAADPTTGKRTTQTVMRVFLNHDRDRLDVTLALPTTRPATAPAATHPQQGRDAETAREQARRMAGHGLRAPPDASTTTFATASSTSGSTGVATAGETEVIHTTANHPWLTADHGWVVAGSLRVGEPVRLLDGGTATVVALHALPGVGPMWDLSLDSVHTFAVGNVQAVVHNIGGGPPDDILSLRDINFTQAQIAERFRNNYGEEGFQNAIVQMRTGELTQWDWDQPVRVFVYDPEVHGIFPNLTPGSYYSLDNQRLAVMKSSLSDEAEIPVSLESSATVAGESYKFTTQNGGTSVLGEQTGTTYPPGPSPTC